MYTNSYLQVFFLSLFFFYNLPLPSVCLHLLFKTFYHPSPSDPSFPSPPLSAFSSHNWVIVFMLHRTGSFAEETWICQNACLKTKPPSCARTQTLMSHESTHMRRRLTSLFWNVKNMTAHFSPTHEDTRRADRKNMLTWIHWDSVGVCAFGLFSPFKGWLLKPKAEPFWVKDSLV